MEEVEEDMVAEVEEDTVVEVEEDLVAVDMAVEWKADMAGEWKAATVVAATTEVINYKKYTIIGLKIQINYN